MQPTIGLCSTGLMVADVGRETYIGPAINISSSNADCESIRYLFTEFVVKCSRIFIRVKVYSVGREKARREPKTSFRYFLGFMGIWDSWGYDKLDWYVKLCDKTWDNCVRPVGDPDAAY